MRGLARIAGADVHRVRRWDALVLGGALPGLVAAVRLGQRGVRVLIVEEAAAHDPAAPSREPFLLTGPEPAEVLGACLRTLGVPLIDQRRFAVEDVAVQVVLPDARLDVGRTARTAAELTAWGLAKPDEARALVRALEQAASAERQAMLEGTSAHGVRHPRARAAEAGTGPAPAFGRGWPREAADAPEGVQRVLQALGCALSNQGRTPPTPEARARLVGGLLSGAAVLGGAQDGLCAMLRRRARALFAEFRSVDQRFDFVSVAGQPALALKETEEIWAARVLILNAPPAGLARTLGDGLPPALRGAPASRRRVRQRYRGPRDAFPEAMGDRVICVPDPDAGAEPPIVTLQRTPVGDGAADLQATAIGPADAPAEGMEAWIEQVIRHLLPFSDALAGQPVREPLWDTDALLSDPASGGWPHPPVTRLSARPPIHQLDRAAWGGLGFEGDLLLGWQAADAIGDELP